jgi:hypothetical protein
MSKRTKTTTTPGGEQSQAGGKKKGSVKAPVKAKDAKPAPKKREAEEEDDDEEVEPSVLQERSNALAMSLGEIQAKYYTPAIMVDKRVLAEVLSLLSCSLFVVFFVLGS